MNGTAPQPRTLPPEGDPRSVAIPSSVDEWLASLAGRGALGALLSPSPEEQEGRGYGHTLREITQQPVTWMETAARMRGLPLIGESLDGASAVVFTGSGSST